MTIRVATVLSARDWEPGLVAYARDTAALRVVLRAYQPSDIEARAKDVDVVVAGGDVAWVTPRQITTWRKLGFGVIGVHPEGDRPSAQLLVHGGADEVVPDSIDVAALVQAIRFVAPSTEKPAAESRGTITAVTGPRGAPGCTEVALAYASTLARTASTLLIDADLSAPALAVRLGLPPRPDITDAADGVRAEGSIDAACLHRVAGISVITGSHRPGEGALRHAMVSGVVDTAASQFEQVVLDIGSGTGRSPLCEGADIALLVVDASAIGIVRAAQVASQWMGPQPQLVLNRVDGRDQADVVEAARRWTGLEPVAIVPERRKVRRATAAAQMPDKRFVRSVSAIGAAT